MISTSNNCQNDCGRLSPHERELLHRCLFYETWGKEGDKTWDHYSDEDYQRIWGTSKGNVLHALSHWYVPVEDEITISVIENVIPRSLGRVDGLGLMLELSDRDKEKWHDRIGASPEEIRFVFEKWKIATTGRLPRRSKYIHKLISVVRSNPATFITCLYLYLSFFGLTYTWTLFRLFGINLLDFATTEDFFLSAFRFPLALVNAVIGLGCGVYLLASQLPDFQEKRIKGRASWVATFCFGFLAWLLAPQLIGAAHVEKQIRSGETDLLWVNVKRSSSYDVCGLSGDPVAIIGITGGHVLIYQPKSGCTAAIEKSGVSSITFVLVQNMEHSKGILERFRSWVRSFFLDE